MGLHLLYGAALLASVHAIAFPGPRPTDSFQALPQGGWSPRPTPGPDAHALLRRQLDLPATYLLAPDNTCGFINGNSKSAYTCINDDMNCAFIPASGKVAGAAGCCKGDDCAFRLSCLDKEEVEDDCDKKCQADALTLKCTGKAKYCNTVSFPGGVTDYYCATKKTKAVIRAQTTHSGDKSREMSTVKPKPTSTKKTTSAKTSSSSTSTSTSTASSSSSSETSSETSSVSSEPPATTSSETDTAVVGAATSSTEFAAAPAPATPTGAIVGGVLGGLALLALIIFGAIFLRQHKRKNEAAAGAPPPDPFMSEPTFGGSQPAAGSFAQSSGASQVAGYPPTSAAPTPAHMYAVPAAAAVGAGVGAAAAGASFRSHPSQHHPHDSVSSGYPAHSNNANTYPHHAHNTNNNNYPDPSPLSTPSGSPHFQQQQQQPQPLYQHQPHAPVPLPQPSYYNQSQSQDHHNNNTWNGPTDTPDRRDNSTPVSTYNGTTPVLPASALGPMPGDPPQQQQQQHYHSSHGSGGGGVSGVPLSLQPGMGYRPYRPGGGSGSGSGSMSGSMGQSRSGSGSGAGFGGASMAGNVGGEKGEARAVTASPGPPEGQQQAHAVVVARREAKGVVVELP